MQVSTLSHLPRNADTISYFFKSLATFVIAAFGYPAEYERVRRYIGAIQRSVTRCKWLFHFSRLSVNLPEVV